MTDDHLSEPALRLMETLSISDARLDRDGELSVLIDGRRFSAGEKYTIVELGWAVYVALEQLPADWLCTRGETLSADGYNKLESKGGILITTHPVLVALSLRAWWHRNGRRMKRTGKVSIPSFEEASAEVRGREILNDFNIVHAGTIPGLSRWKQT